MYERNIFRYRKFEDAIKNDGYAPMHIGDEIPRLYLKFISYIPKHWNINDISEKQALDLTIEEIKTLKKVKEDLKFKEIFEEYLSSDKKKARTVLEVIKYVDAHSIESIVKRKFRKEEKDYCNKKINELLEFNDEEIETAINIIKNNHKNSVLDEYIIYTLTNNLDKNKVNANTKIKSKSYQHSKDKIIR